MASLYDAVRASNSTYVPQFVGSTFNELSEAGKALDTRWRQNKDYSDKIAMMLENEQYLENDRAIKDQLRENIYGQIDDIASSEANFENSTAAVSQAARDFFTNQQRIAAQENFRLAEKAREMENQGFNLNFGDNRRTFSTVGEDGTPRRFNLDMQKQLDYSKKMQELLGRVAADGGFTTPTGQVIKVGEDERNAIMSKNWQAISPEKLNRLVENLLPAYKESEEGRQHLRKLTELDGIEDKPLTIKEGKVTRTTNTLDEILRGEFRAVAAPQGFYAAVGRFDDYGETAASLAKKAMENLAVDGAPGSVTENNVAVPVPAETGDKNTHVIPSGPRAGTFVQYRDKETGKIVPIEEVVRTITGTSGPLLPNMTIPRGGGVADVYSLAKEFYKEETVDGFEINKRKEALFDKSSRLGYNFTDKNHFERSLASANDRIQKTTVNGFEILDDQKEFYNKSLNAGLARNKIITPSGKVINLDQLAKSWGVNSTQIKVDADQRFYESPNSNIPPGYIEARVVIDGKAPSGEGYKSVFLPVGNTYSAASAPIDHLFKNSLFLGQDKYDGSFVEGGEINAFYPTVGKDPIRTKDGGIRGFFTATALIPEEQQVDGQYPYTTVVYPVTRYKSGNNVRVEQMVDEDGEPISYPIEEWKAMMDKSVIGPRLMNIIKSGKSAAPTDLKKHNPYSN